MGIYDDNDSGRTQEGQFLYTPYGATEQASAGVGQGDDVWSAQGKVQAYRMSMALDPNTGLPPAQNLVGGTPPRVVDPAKVAADLAMARAGWVFLMRIVLWPAAVVVALGAIACGAASIGMRLDAPTLTARAAQGEFADYEAPLASLFDERTLSAPVKPAQLYAAVKSYKTIKASDFKKRRAHELMGEAYRCVLQPGCRDGTAQIDDIYASRLPREAEGFFEDRVKSGDEEATRDMCLFMVKAGTSYKDMVAARNLCAEANFLNKGSAAGALALARIDGSWAMRRAWIYYKWVGLQFRWEHNYF